MRRILESLAGFFVAIALLGTAGAQEADPLNDYPTVARADYVFACMATNGQSRTALEQCSCSIDVIARLMPYERYVQAETILRTLQVGGERVAAFRGSARSREMVADLRRAQAEADINCF
ncbi:MAG TPA: hypothetical protein VFR34_10200 [Paracoccaceae bacterium]|nr:hypothetical protein [Paracoccaceae bacterium]